MTVKELKEILDGCNDDAVVRVETGSVIYDIHDNQIFHVPARGENNSMEVIIDVIYGVN